MLRPTKHEHPDQTLINVATLLLLYLKKRGFSDYDTLRGYIKKKVVGGDALYIPALNFLYLFDLVEYRPKIDAIEYTGPNK